MVQYCEAKCRLFYQIKLRMRRLAKTRFQGKHFRRLSQSPDLPFGARQPLLNLSNSSIDEVDPLVQPYLIYRASPYIKLSVLFSHQNGLQQSRSRIEEIEQCLLLLILSFRYLITTLSTQLLHIESPRSSLHCSTTLGTVKFIHLFKEPAHTISSVSMG